ncbi:MAG: DUF3575 domain-containing protein [Prevotella sp.]|nr:DUF3575 domain-containing protein [Prevotella sp.]
MTIGTKEKGFLTSMLLAMMLLMTPSVKAQQVTVSNNLLYDALLTPNLRVGLRLSPHWSMGVTGGYRPWPTSDNVSTKWRHLLVSPDVRYWTDSVNVHHFFGVNLIYSHYNLANLKFPFGLYKGFRHERREGDLGALGAFYGYSWPLGRHWNLEALIGAVVGYAKYDRYACGKCGTKIGDDNRWFVLPQAGINIVYNIPGRPAKKVPQVVIPPIIDTIQTVQPPIIETVPVDTVPAPPKERNIDILLRTEPILAHISDYKPYDRSQVLRRDKAALFVYFPMSKSEILPDWRDNKQTLDRIMDVTEKMMADKDSKICKIQIVGLASWDGYQSFNERVAKERAYSLKKYIQERMPLGDDMFELNFGGEDWADFRDQLQEEVDGLSGDAKQTALAKQLQQVLDIIDTEPNLGRREQKIRKLRGGRTYEYLKKHHLTDQRNAGYLRVYFDYVDN